MKTSVWLLASRPQGSASNVGRSLHAGLNHAFAAPAVGADNIDERTPQCSDVLSAKDLIAELDPQE